MIRIAHLTDLHLNGSKERRDRLRSGLGKARAAGAKHLLLTGDLTAFGTESQCRELAGVLEDDWPASSGLGKTVVAGNHDGWGPIDRIFPAHGPVDLGGVVVVPVDTRFHRRALAFRALGAISKDALFTVDRVSRDSGRPVVVAMHHGPATRGPKGIVAGLVGSQGLRSLLTQRQHVHVCCGHDHRRLDIGNVHAAAAVAHHPSPLRIYDVVDGGFHVR